ncbi:tyrosine-type recombinase/integrase, partial [Ruminococcus sp.]|uniref:tyrosine-type recombinase/integrase n=1 Tax=Ruminococcus sp. TaxID=41978 RepID=UPI002E7889B4
LKKGRLTLEGSLIIKGNYYYAKFRVNGKQKMIATKIPVNGYDKSHNFIVRTVLGKSYVNLSAINRVVNRLTENAGLPHCTIHGFRHSVASILDDNGVPIQDISVLLGHESVQTTERIYINRRKTAKETTINALDSAINLNIA